MSWTAEDVRHVPGAGTRHAVAEHPSFPISTADRVIASAAALLAFATYLRTIYPGLTSIGDATKFAFVAKVLGTPHAPGYPLYVGISHLFSYLPFGTLAYRMNVLAAICGATAVGLGYVLARRLGARRAIAVGTALALGFGNAFWSRSLYAKGTYTLSAVIVSTGMLVLLRWSETRRRRHLLAAVALFALSLGNHLTVVALLPALAIFVVLTDWRAAIRPSTLAAVAALVVTGLAQYLLILVRTAQHAPYLEARAVNLHELWGVMTARRFATEVGAFSWSALLTERVPIVWGLVVTEIHLLGVAALLFGVVTLIRHRWRVALLFALGAFGVITLTANMSSNEDQGFLLAAFVLLWPLAAVGMERMAVLARRAGPGAAAAAALILAAVMPADQVAANFQRNDHHRATFETEYFDALFSVLPSRTAIIDDEYYVNMLLHYKLLGERAAGSRSIAIAPATPAGVRRYLDAGYAVYAFRSGRADLEEYGAVFEPADLPFSPSQQAIVRRRNIFRLTWAPVCLEVGAAGWQDYTPALEPRGTLSIRLDDYRPFDADVTIYGGSDVQSTPLLFGESGAGTPHFGVEVFDLARAGGPDALRARAAGDGYTPPADLLGHRFVTRTVVQVNDEGQWAQFGVDLGPSARAAAGRARVDIPSPRRAVVCSHAMTRSDAWPSGQSMVEFGPESRDVRFAGGWYPSEERSDGVKFRWTSDRATLVLPIEYPRAAVIRVEAEPFKHPARGNGSLTLSVNGRSLGSRALPDDLTVLEWAAPADAWRAGLNTITFDIAGAGRPSDQKNSTDTRLLGVSVRRITLVEAPGS